MRPVGADRVRHVGDAEDAVIAVGIGVLRVGISRQSSAAVANSIVPPKKFGVGHDQRALLAVDFDRRVPVAGTSKLIVDRAPRRRSTKTQRARDMGRDLDRNASPFSGSLVIIALGPRSGRDAADARDRPEQIDKVGDVVRPHVEHRPAAGEVVEAGLGMPALMARAHEEGGAADRPADRAVVDQLARGLVAAAEERVGRAADAQASCRRRPRSSLARLGDIDAERLFGMDVLAGGDRPEADLDMRFRHREVEDDLDRGIGEQRLDRARRNAEFRRARLGRRGVGVGKRDDVEDRKLPAPPSDRRR